MVTKYLVIKDVIHTNEDFNFNNTFSANWKQEMFLSWAIDRNCIKHDLLLGLSNFVVNCFSIQKSEFLHSHSLDYYYMYNLLITKGYKLGGVEGIATKNFYGDHFTIEGCQRVILAT